MWKPILKLPIATCLAVLTLGTGMPRAAFGLAAVPTADVVSTETAFEPAARRISAFYDVLLDAMKHANKLGIKGRYKKIKSTIDTVFDFPTMTKEVVGPEWASLTKAQRNALIDAFRRMTIADYARNFDGYEGETFVVDPNVQKRGDDEFVSTKMTSPNKAPVTFVYRMIKTADGWKIIDVYWNGTISQVATKRADFASTLANQGASVLAEKLNAMTDRTLKGH